MSPMLWRMASTHSSLSSLSSCIQVIPVFFLCVSLLVGVDGQNRSYEVQALLDFRVQTVEDDYDIAKGFWQSWNQSDENACLWAGVACTPNFTVEELYLSDCGLGLIPTFQPLSALTDLRHLDLSSNNLLPGAIAEDICDFIGQITWLDVSKCNLEDVEGQSQLANISACQRLRFLNLAQNSLTGVIPSNIGDLKDLQFLLLADNEFSGPFPKELVELTSLISIDLSNNSLNGSIPALSDLTKLVSLKLDNNSFTKFEQSWFSTVAQSLQVLSVSFNQLEGVLPSIITIRDLEVINLSGNRLSGQLPSKFESRQPNYEFSLDFSQNNFTGEISFDLLYMPGMTPFILGGNCYSLNLSHNLLTGNVLLNGTSQYCYNLLDFSHNNLSGVMPYISANGTISSLRLGYNNLSGDIVDLLITAVVRYELRGENNSFTGDLSRLLDTGHLLFPEIIDLTNNHLQWSVSEAIPDPITATLLKVSGPFPFGITEFRVGGNNFSGTSLPAACFGVPGLSILDLSNSHLKGQILDAAFNSTCLPVLQFLNLSQNEITGHVSDSIVILPRLEILDLSNNYLSGHLPTPNSTSLYNPSFFEGNAGLCGFPLPSCPQRGTGVQWWVLLIIIGGFVVIALGSCLVATWRWRVYHKRHQQDADLIKTLLERESAVLISLRELRKATENFAESAQIGEGGFGTVYRGKLNNGTIVAIKRSKREGTERDKAQFLNEVRILSQVKHRNLVKLLGCCMENKIAVLVFEFIPNGTLQEHLQKKGGAECLTWEQRLKIAVQTADALNYLHAAAVYPIYHRDVKSANILLDGNLNAKVADFGISKLVPLQATHVSTVAIQGTIGYIDPESYTSGQLTDKSDVYSFGVVLLELISAKPALDNLRGGDEISLVFFASPYIEREDMQGLIDPDLSDTYNDLVGSGRESILAVGNLAMKCLDMRSKARPTMEEALKELQNLWADLAGTSNRHLSEDDNEDLQHGYGVLLPHALSGDSCSFVMQSNASGIQMAQLSGHASLRSRSMEQ